MSDDELAELLTPVAGIVQAISDGLCESAAMVREAGATYTASEVADLLTAMAANVQQVAEKVLGGPS